MDFSWSRWHRTTADQGSLAQLMFALYSLEADQLAPDHPIFQATKVCVCCARVCVCMCALCVCSFINSVNAFG